MGVGRIEDIAKDILRVVRKAGPAFALARVEKRYVVAAKVFDTLFDSYENKAVPWHVYNVPVLRITMVFKVAYIFEDGIVADFFDALLDKNADRASAKMAAFCRSLRARIDLIPDQRSKDIVGEALDWAAENPESLEFVHSSKVGRKGHLPNMVGFGNLLGGIEKQSAVWNRPVEWILHDRQQEFAAAIKFWHEIYANTRDDVLQVPFSGKMVLRKVFGSQLKMTSAQDSPGIQIIDVILWLFARSMKEDLPTNCQNLLNYVYSRAHQDDFSFANAGAAAEATIEQVNSAHITSDMMAQAKLVREQIEQRRLVGMEEYARAKATE